MNTQLQRRLQFYAKVEIEISEVWKQIVIHKGMSSISKSH